MSPPFVLVTDHGNSQNRTSLATVRALAAGGYRPAVTTVDRWSLAAASRHCARRVPLPRLGPADYAQAIEQEQSGGTYVTALVTSDLALLALDASVRHLLDKLSLREEAAKVGIASPPTRSFPGPAELMKSAADLDYPVVVKPALSRFRPFRALDASGIRTGLPSRSLGCALMVQPYIGKGLRAICGVMWGEHLVAAVHQGYLRTWPPDCGGASAAFTTGPDEDMEERLAAMLSCHEGVFMAQFAGDYLLDLNPRPYGSLPLAVAAGANLVTIFCDLLRGKAPPTGILRGEPDVFYRWLEGDVRNVVRQFRGRRMSAPEALGALRPRPGAAAGTESWRDPAPAVVRIASALWA